MWELLLHALEIDNMGSMSSAIRAKKSPLRVQSNLLKIYYLQISSLKDWLEQFNLLFSTNIYDSLSN